MSLMVQGLFTQKFTYRQPLGCDASLRSDSRNFVPKTGYRGEMRLSARPCCVNGATTANRRFRFLGFARNHYGIVKARQGDESGWLREPVRGFT